MHQKKNLGGSDPRDGGLTKIQAGVATVHLCNTVLLSLTVTTRQGGVAISLFQSSCAP